MIRTLPLMTLVFIGTVALANEMFLTPPTEYVVSGNDRYGDSAYEIRALLTHADEGPKIRELTVTIYDESISVAAELLAQVDTPDFGAVKVINDAGIFGSYFYIDIPFGDIPRCRAARKHKQRMSLHISSLGTMDDEGLKASIFNPCD